MRSVTRVNYRKKRKTTRCGVIFSAFVALWLSWVPAWSWATPRGAPVADKIVVSKSDRLLVLYAKGKEIRRYSVALGGNPVGPKEREWDSKTPEGTYSIIGRNSKSAYHRSLRISYPSASDKERAARLGVSPGKDIMIHGLPNGRGAIGAAHRLRDWTDGCIAVTDEEIEEIWELVPDGTPIQINP